MRVLGIDPGSKRVGVAIIDFDKHGQATWEHAEELTPEGLDRVWLANTAALHKVDRVAIELPKPRAMGALRQLVGTAELAGYVRGLAECLDLDPMQITSYEWRKRLCGNSNAKDAIIKYALEAHLDVPKSNSHKRDAAGVALVCGWEMFFSRMVA